jgi:Zn-dependent M28 family amino/carboxypeptidase
MIIVCGHYDSRASDVMDSTSDAPGADDDGSGIAVTLELARVLSAYEFDATLVFICFAGEEQGLLGSTAWTVMAQEGGLPVEAVLSNDIVGGIEGGNYEVDSTHVRIFSEALAPKDTGTALRQLNTLGLENDGGSRSLARYCKEIGEKYVPGITVDMIYRLDRFLRGGDHAPFHQRGYAAVRVSEAKENYDHQHQSPRIERGHEFGDLAKFVNLGYLNNIARVNAAVVATLAWAPPAPPSVLVMTDSLEYRTRLSWKPSLDRREAGYLIRRRKTPSPVWEDSSEFTTDTTFTINLSKDDYLFGIQSCDQSGNVSLPVLPLPKR